MLTIGCALASLPAVALAVSQERTIPLELGAIPPKDMIALVPGGIEKALAALPSAIADTMKRSGVPGMAVAVVAWGTDGFRAELCCA